MDPSIEPTLSDGAEMSISESEELKKAKDFISTLKGISKEEKDEMIKELDKERSCCIMACGLTGVGKSTILNGIVGPEGPVFKEGETLGHETIQVNKEELKKGDVTLKLCDTPGFNDSSDNEEAYIKRIRENCKNVDLLLYCVSVRPTTANMADDLAILKKLKKALNKDIWGKCIVVMTFANVIANRLEVKTKNIEKEFNKIIDIWKERIQTTLKEAKIDPNVVANIPIVPAGRASQPSLLNNSDYWLSDLWATAFDVVSFDGQVVLILFNAPRFKLRKDLNPRNDFEGKLSDHPIVPKENAYDRFRAKFPRIAAAVGTGGAAGVTGAGIGAIIGALAIGLPTFGVAAGVGLLLGGMIGGASGIGAGLLVAKVASKVKERREANAEELDSESDDDA